MPDPINYSLINHQGSKRIAIHFAYNKEWNERMNKVGGARWSKSLQCWHIPDTFNNRKKCGLGQETNLIVQRLPHTSKIASTDVSANNAEQLQNIYTSFN